MMEMRVVVEKTTGGNFFEGFDDIYIVWHAYCCPNNMRRLSMLDAFIIEQLKKETEEVQPLPLTLELPEFEEKEEEKESNKKEDTVREITVFRF
jgi:hypothetical protein